MADSTRTVVITGASCGFGEGAVRAFAGQPLQDAILKDMQLDAVLGGVSP